jgi:hypothetical protein
MKKISEHSFLELLRLEPIRAILKQIRNDVLLFLYKKKSVKNEALFIAELKKYKDKNLLVVIAFEQPKVLEWLFSLSKRNLRDFQLVIFDNSRDVASRARISQVCQIYNVPYLGLPFNYSHHPNRSHGMAMTWVFHRIIKRIEPSWFGFLDHDMYPVRPVSIESLIPVNQFTYGLINDAPRYWNLWAGYCFFKCAHVSGLPLNFLYDFSRGIDTGGRNWPYLYASMNKSLQQFATVSYESLKFGLNSSANIQLVDNAWIHVGGVGYGDNYQMKQALHASIVQHLLAGLSFVDLQSQGIMNG